MAIFNSFLYVYQRVNSSPLFHDSYYLAMICYTSRQVPLLQIFSRYQNASQVAVSLPGLQIQG